MPLSSVTKYDYPKNNSRCWLAPTAAAVTARGAYFFTALRTKTMPCLAPGMDPSTSSTLSSVRT